MTMPAVEQQLEYYAEQQKLSILLFFKYSHLPAGLMRNISWHHARLAVDYVEQLEPSAERSAGLRKLLEAKDCAVRAAMPHAAA